MGGSSSHRRKSTRASRNGSRRNSPSRNTTVSSTPVNRVLNFDHLQITQGIGFNLLKKSGWVPGEPLGTSPSTLNQLAIPIASTLSNQPSSSSSPSTSTPIPIVIKHGRGGIGAPHRNLSNQQFFSHESPITPHSLPNRLPNRHDMLTWQHDSSPDLVKQLANMDIYDPLRPRCQYDPNHVVRNLKALHKHELNCPANPNRTTNRRDPIPSSTFNPSQSMDTIHASSVNPFSTLAPGESFDNTSHYSSDQDESSIISSMSDYSDEETSDTSVDQDNICMTDQQPIQEFSIDVNQSAISTDNVEKLS